MATTMPAPLIGKIALVTGGSRGIGAAVATTLAKQGCSHIAITFASKPDGAEATLSECKKVSPNIKTAAIKANLEEPGFTDKVIDGTLKELGVDHIDIVVLNAAVLTGTGPTRENWDRMIIGNAWTQFEMCEKALPHVPKGGRFVLISSGASKVAMGKDNIPYSCSKAALDTISRNLAREYGVAKEVTFNTVSVGATDTDALWGNADKIMVGMGKDAFISLIEGMSLMNRIGSPQEVADIVCFLASPMASWINGNQIPANGGALAMAQS